MGDTFLLLYPCTSHPLVSKHRKFVIVGKCNLFYGKKSEKIDFTHILAKVYTTPFAGRHLNTVARMEYVTKTIFIINSFSFKHVSHARMHTCKQTPEHTGIKHRIMRLIKNGAATHYYTRAWQTLIHGKDCFILLLYDFFA